MEVDTTLWVGPEKRLHPVWIKQKLVVCSVLVESPAMRQVMKRHIQVQE